MEGISRNTDEETGLRWYSDGDTIALSVTTVLKFLEEDTGGLEYWKRQNDGEGDNAHHEHIYWYSAPRGTLCHYQALKIFEDQFDGDEDMWGEEESESMQSVMEGPDEDEFDEASTDLNDITYSILNNQDVVTSREEYEHLFEDSTRLVDILHKDTQYFTNAFTDICEHFCVDEESVVRVEKFMLEDDVGYGGQCDLLYEDPNGDVVLADLKTSSGLRQKHRLQSVAYMHAVQKADWGPDDVDRLEVWRIDPDAEEWVVHTDTEADYVDLSDEYYTDDNWFVDKYGDFEYEDLDEMYETFRSLVAEAHSEVSEVADVDE